VLQSIFHVNINCTNFARSLEFYQKLGFKVIRDLGEASLRKVNPGLRLPVDARLHAVLMILGDDPRSTRIDLIEWKGPKTVGPANSDLLHAGVARIALRTKTLLEDYADLKAKGIEFWSEPILIEVKEGRLEGFVCCQDPDGTVIELIQV
jgi:catechol 2,3-dioxygenase-like lactoylglutathione lyase family enzyme